MEKIVSHEKQILQGKQKNSFDTTKQEVVFAKLLQNIILALHNVFKVSVWGYRRCMSVSSFRVYSAICDVPGVYNALQQMETSM